MPVEEDLLTEISDWVNDRSSPAIYLLIGPHGSEASAAAHVIARRFDAISRLGSSYCLARNRQSQQRPTNLFSTIARDLADHDPEFMACLGGIVKRQAVGCSPHIPTQFNFILAPAQQLTSFGPVLIVIDALDACGDTRSRADILSVLKEKAQNLPPSFKFLITCLPDTDIATLRYSAHVLPKELEVVATKQLCDQRFTTDRINPHLSTPPIQTAFPQRAVQVQASTDAYLATDLLDPPFTVGARSSIARSTVPIFVQTTLEMLLSRIDIFVRIGRVFAEVCVCLSHLRTD